MPGPGGVEQLCGLRLGGSGEQGSSSNQVVIQQTFAVPEGQGGATDDGGGQAVEQAYARAAKQGAQEQIARDLRPGGQIWAAINGRG